MRLSMMRHLLPCLAILAAADVARADFGYEVFVDNTLEFSSTQASGGTLSLTGLTTTGFNVFSGLVTSNADQVTGSQGSLHGTFQLKYSGTGTHTLSIIVSDNGFSIPNPPNYQMSSSSSYTATTQPSHPFGSGTFQGFAAAGQNLYGMTVPTNLDSYNPLTGSGNSTTSNNTFTAASGYTLTQEYTWTANAGNIGFNVMGSTVTTPVPEPSSLALLGVSSFGLVAIRHRRRKR